ncbi:hypothetical protein EGH21_13615 [Halomicroarcula sp. F13]|uniref:Uncharacterized protein n=1 Tax=Haloarcula rubra TaxID=2487747 RepID=A0AAW4PS52_9EURY|nr:hypothetical protein [Halomicroarcula rubra]MBX0324070.1 hypothetical protein [Halomicroarcula rubra]
MRRRALLTSLAAAGAGLAGCSFGDGGGDPEHTAVDPPETDTTDHSQPQRDTETDRRTGDPPRPAEPPHVVELETGPRTYALSPYIRADDGGRVALWFDRTATADHPARLRGWLRNGNDFENTFRVRRIPVVGDIRAQQPRGYDHEASLHLAPTERNDLAAAVPAVVRDETGYWRVEDVGPWLTETRRLAPGEWVRLEYEVVGSPGMSERPTGTYEFGDEATLSVWDTTSPGPDTDSRFAGRSLPAFPGDGDVQWYHEADAETVAFVRPSTERVDLDGLVAFEVVNHSHERLRCGHWNLYKLVDGEWFRVGPWIHTSDCRLLSPGERKQWPLRAFNGEAVPTGGDCHGGLTRGHLGGGEYAVVAGYGHPEPESGALVELVGDPATVAPTADVTTERDGSTVTVTSERYGDDDHPPDATFTLQYAAAGGERVVAEQVMRPSRFGGDGRGLRNALPFLSADVDRVVVRTDAHVVDSVVGDERDARRYTFRGRDYLVSRGASGE